MTISHWVRLVPWNDPRARAVWKDGAWIALAAALGALVYLQGWRSNPMKSADILPYAQAAWQLVARGQMIDHGNLTSFLSFNPPGLVFFFAPGALLESDPRLWEIPGLFFLLLVELIFLYLIARWIFGRVLALAAVAVVGISLLGNPGLWTDGHPAFILAALYFLLVWIKNRSTLALSIAIVITAFGLYVYMGMLPFAFVFPALWVAYRPPISVRKVVIALALSVLIWAPFLRFEFGRGFVDLRSMVLRETPSALAKGGSQSLPRCYTSPAGLSDTLEGSYIDRGVSEGAALPIVPPGVGFFATSRYKLCVAFVNLDRNFDTDYFTLGLNQTLNAALWLLFAWGLVTMLVADLSQVRILVQWLEKLWKVRWGYVVAGAFLGAAVLWGVLSPALLDGLRARLHMDRQWLGVLKQLRSFAPLIWGAALLGTYTAKRWARIQRGIGVVGLALGVSWLLLVALAEPDRAMRIWWLWPLEILAALIAVEAMGKTVLPKFQKASTGLVIAAALLMLPISYWRPKMLSWAQAGFSGHSTGRLEAADFVGSEVRREGHTAVQVGYDVAEADWSTQYQETQQPAFLKGAWIDFLLLSRHGVVNLDQSASRISAQDEFRISEHAPGESSGVGSPPDWPSYTIVARFGSYDVYKQVVN
jgi:hypothetical protein